jgi:hypothetical protein
MTAVLKHRETSAHNGNVAGCIVRSPPFTLLCQSTHNLLVPVEPESSWRLISRSQYNWEEEVSPQLSHGGHNDERSIEHGILTRSICYELPSLLSSRRPASLPNHIKRQLGSRLVIRFGKDL